MSLSSKVLRSLAIAGPLLAAGCEAPDRLALTFRNDTGQPVPSGLSDPARWVYVGNQTVPGAATMMAWAERPDGKTVKPPAKAVNLKRPAKPAPPDWVAWFEYQDLPKPAVGTDQYLAYFRSREAAHCPSATVTPVKVDKSELVLEATSGGCPTFGTQSEVDRFVFAETRMFHMVYAVRTPNLSAPDREAALRAVNAWQLEE